MKLETLLTPLPFLKVGPAAHAFYVSCQVGSVRRTQGFDGNNFYAWWNGPTAGGCVGRANFVGIVASENNGAGSETGFEMYSQEAHQEGDALKCHGDYGLIRLLMIVFGLLQWQRSALRIVVLCRR